MAVIQAPYPGIVAEMTIPPADLGDRRSLIADLKVYDMEDGTVRTIVRTAYKKKFEYRFKMAGDSSREFSQFLKLYSTSQMLLDGKAVYLEQSSIPAVFDERDFVSFNLRFREA